MFKANDQISKGNKRLITVLHVILRAFNDWKT